MRRVFYTLCALLFVVVSTAFSVVDSPTVAYNEAGESVVKDSSSLSRRHLEAVRSLHVWKDTLRAERLWREIVAEDGNYAPALYNLSLLHRANLSEATPLAKRAYYADTTNKWYLDSYATMLFDSEEFDEALPLFKRLLAMDSHQTSTYYYLSCIYVNNEDIDSAISILDSAEVRMGHNVYLDRIKVELLISTHQYDRAISLGRRVVDDSPYDVDARLSLAATYERAKRDSLARATYEEAYLIDTTRLETIVELLDFNIRQGNLAEQFKWEGLILGHERVPLDVKLERMHVFMEGDFYRNNFFHVGGLLNVLVKHYPTDRDVVHLNTQYLCNGGMIDQATEYLRSHTYDANVTPEDFSLLVALNTQLEDQEALFSDVERGLALFSEDVQLIGIYSLLHHYSDDTKGAIRILSDASKRLKKSEDLSYCWGRIGDLYHEIDNDKQAFKAYRKALDYNPENAEVLNNYAYFLSLRNEQLDKALAMSSLAIVLEADNYNYIDTHAWVLHCLGRNDEAKRYMRQALMLSQHGEASLLAHYGDILWALGERFMAETYWKKAIDAGYDADEMAEHIAQLKQDK